MSTIHFKETTTATPEEFLAALGDFGPGRSKVFSNSADELPDTSGCQYRSSASVSLCSIYAPASHC